MYLKTNLKKTHVNRLNDKVGHAMHIMKKLTFLTVAGVLLDGCNMTSLLWSKDENAEAHPVYAESQSGKVIKQYDEDERAILVSQYIEEWQELKPTLNKVIALESELSYVLKELDKVDSSVETMTEVPKGFLQSFEKDMSGGSRLVDSSLQNSNTTTKQTPALESAEVTSNLGPASISQAARNNVKLASAQQVPQRLSDNVNGVEQIDAKFSSKPSPLLENSYKAVTAVSRSNSKSCGNDSLSRIGEGFAVHLASYSKQASLAEGKNVFQGKYADHLCQKTAVVKAVSVKGRDFYSLRYGPYETRTEAQKVCNDIRIGSDYCTISQFEGERLN